MLLTYASFFILIGSSIGGPIVKTTLGDIEGYYQTSYNGRNYSAFEGIPFAKPPEGILRFEEPVPVEPWNNMLNASTTHTCVQLDTPDIFGKEDCLYLNVYVPNLNPTPNDNLDVIVYVHGGSFTVGKGIDGGPKYFMDRDVVYVNINYRLSVFGFLSTQDEVVPGNNGLKDQTLALKWVQQHIKKFGGNPNSVTFVGFSAGAISVHLHFFSQTSKGLFHRAISNSGTALMPCAVQKHGLEQAKKLSALLGCDNPSTRVFIDCMKNKSAELILENVAHLESPAKRFPLSPFEPVVEPKSATAFLEDYPFNLLEKNKFLDVPWLNSIVGAEGLLGLLAIRDDIEDADRLWNERAQHYLELNYTVCEKDREVVAKTIRERYFGSKNISLDSAQEIIDVFGDRYFGHSFETTARLQAASSKSPVYTYVYNYSTSYARVLHEDVLNLPKIYGVLHREDNLITYHDADYDDLVNLTKTDEEVKDLLLDIATSFAKNGVPSVRNINWTPVTVSDDISYLYIESPTKIEMATKREIAPREFWNNLPIMENEKVNENCKEDL